MQSTQNILVDDSLLAPYLPEEALFAHRLAAFVGQQLAAWPELRQAHEGLRQSLHKKFSLADLEVELQHNPFRIKSSAAKVDKKTIGERACFLCPENLYPDQRALAYGDGWLLLCNPYPIFPGHLVVSSSEHSAQEIRACLGAMLSFVADAQGGFEAFYNGPACGASAPDHLHFQACPAGGIPLVEQVRLLMAAGLGITQVSDLEGQGACFAGEADRRGLFVCRSADGAAIEKSLLWAISFLKEATRAPDEPLVNIIIAADGPDLIGILLPRKAHRPACYFREGDDRMLVSPGAVDVGGLLVLPRPEDYERITREQVLGIFAEVCEPGKILMNFSAERVAP